MANINSVLIPNLAEENCPISENFIVVFADRGTDRLCAINQLGSAKKPITLSHRYVMALLKLGHLSIGTLELSENNAKPDSFFSKASIEKRDKQYQAILPIVENLEEFLFNPYGTKFVENIASDIGIERCQVYSWLYRYLREGQTKNSLLPKYTNGCRQANTAYPKKLGRPRKNSNFKGMNITEKDKSNILKTLRKHYATYGGKPLTACYEELLKDFYCESKTVQVNGNIKHTLKSEDEIPTLGQFIHWADKLMNENGINAPRKRMGTTTYDRECAGRNGEIIRPDGPGQIYQLDSTPSNHELISEFSRDRTSRVGRSTDYRLVDAFTSGVAGLHTTLAPPSWAEARIAIFNAIRSKPDYCAEYGVTITNDDWPFQGVPMTIYVDNAELASNLAAGIPASLCTIKFGRVWRGDDKPLVEKAHDLHATRLQYHIPGFISKSEGERGVPSAKATALLTLREYTQLLIKTVIQRNNSEELDGKWMTKEMTKDGVRPHARDLYLWGEINRPFTKKSISDEEIYLTLLEKGEAKIHKEGIYFKKLWYRSKWTLDQGLQNKKGNKNKSIPIEIRYLRYNANYILLCTQEGFKLAELHHKSQRFNNVSFEEVELQIESELKSRGDREKALHESRADLIGDIDKTVADAKKQQVTLPPSQVRGQNIATNKSLDLFEQRTQENLRMESAIEKTFHTEETKQEHRDETEQERCDEMESEDTSLAVAGNGKTYQATMLELLKGNP